MAILFISDLHLSDERPQITALFLDFMLRQVRQAEALYILGDLFEYWIGDDAVQPDHQPVIQALRSTVENGIPVYFMRGNRDFLIGEGFAAQSGCRILEDPIVTDIHRQPVLLMHGDTLCTDDHDYQKFRTMVRDPEWQQDFLSKPVSERLQLAHTYRAESKTQTQRKPPDIMDVNQQQVEQEMRRYQVNLFIHGHTHRPAIHELMIDGNKARRIVLGDWYRKGSMLICDKHDYRMEDITD